MIKLFDILTEGVYDPGIFKAVFTAGGPGSGKSYTASTLFGMPERMPYVTAAGLKGVNSDSTFEAYLDKAKMDKNMEKLSKRDYDLAQGMREKAKRVTIARMNNFINSKLGLLIDGTGKNYGKIAKMKKRLESEGYDCFMVFVNTDLEVALERNRKRDRVVPEHIVKSAWKEVNNNLGKFQGLFGASNMLVIDNSTYKEFAPRVKKAAASFTKKPIQNHLAKKWIKQELQFRNFYKKFPAGAPNNKGGKRK